MSGKIWLSMRGQYQYYGRIVRTSDCRIPVGIRIPRIAVRRLHDGRNTSSMSPQSQQQRAASSGGGNGNSNSNSNSNSSNPFLLKSRGDFKTIQASRPDFNRTLQVEVSKTPDPDWVYGKGVNSKSNSQTGEEHHLLQHVEIDPYQPGRPFVSNYRLLIAGIPRPISFVSTVSKTTGDRNLAPFSYFQVVDHDPPIFVIGFSARKDRPKDTYRNLVETGECVINLVSDHMVEAVNATSLDVPYGVSEWELSGLQGAPSTTVKPQRVKDAILSIEGKLLEMKELSYNIHRQQNLEENNNDGDESSSGDSDVANRKPHGALAIIQGTRFWVREDALNHTHDDIDLDKMKPLVQLGGISYGRVRETFELPRPGLEAELKNKSKGLQQFLPKHHTE